MAITELANVLERAGDRGRGPTPTSAASVSYDWGWVKLVQAWHTSTVPGSAERPYSPDPGHRDRRRLRGWWSTSAARPSTTSATPRLFSDLKLIAERTPVDVALIPIGGHYTMDRHDAVVAAEFVGAETVIPIHYDTFPPIETDAEAFKSDVESQTSSKVEVLKPGESLSL